MSMTPRWAPASRPVLLLLLHDLILEEGGPQADA